MAEHALAVLVDFENMARPGAKSRGDFDINLVIDRLNEKGRVIVKRAYADWSRYREAKHQLQNAGLELIEMPSAREGAKNRADIKLAVDAMELAYSREHVTSFVIVSGDSDFTPLVGKLRELNKRVIGVGNRESTSDLLVANCDEFIYYENISGAKTSATTGRRGAAPSGAPDVASLLQDTLTALQREGVEWPLASVVKDSMRRKSPAFDERDAGFGTFSKLLEDAAAKSVVRIETDPRSGTYRVELATSTAQLPDMGAAAPAEDRGEADGNRRRRRRRPRAGEQEGAANGLGDLPDGAEVFEVVVADKRDREADLRLGDLPPIGEPISYEDVILLGAEVDAEVPELIEATDLARLETAEPSTKGSRRRRRRFSAEPEPTSADLASLVEEDADANPPAAAAPFEITPMSADDIRAAFEAGTAVRFTVEGVEHTDETTLGSAAADGDSVVRSWTTAEGAVKTATSKTLDAGVKYIAAGRKGAFRAVSVSAGAPAEVAETAPPVEPTVAEADAAADSASATPRRRRSRSRATEAAEESSPVVEVAPVVEEAPETSGAAVDSDAPVRPASRRLVRRRGTAPTE